MGGAEREYHHPQIILREKKMERGATLLLFLAAALPAYALPYGAPSVACPNIYPTGHDRPANKAEVSDSPFKLDLSPFFLNQTGAAGYYYQPGAKYKSKK